MLCRAVVKSSTVSVPACRHFPFTGKTKENLFYPDWCILFLLFLLAIETVCDCILLLYDIDQIFLHLVNENKVGKRHITNYISWLAAFFSRQNVCLRWNPYISIEQHDKESIATASPNFTHIIPTEQHSCLSRHRSQWPVRTFSKSCMTLAGEKKWVTMTCTRLNQQKSDKKRNDGWC